MNLWNKWSELKYNNRIVSGTSIKNYLINDPIIDWLEEYYYGCKIINKNNKICRINKPHINKKPKKMNNKLKTQIIESLNNKSLNTLFANGNIFETKIINELKKKFSVCTINKKGQKGYNNENYNKTISAIKSNKYDIIYQGIFIYKEAGIGGSPDIIIKGSALNKLTNLKHLYVDENFLNEYFILDIKWSMIPLLKNSNYIKNIGLFPAYKGQLAIYNYILGKITGKIQNKCYILGKGWKTCNNTNFESYDILGIINYETYDNIYIEKTFNAINWIHNMRENGNKWNLLEPECIEMYPNCNNNDLKWKKIKNDIAYSIGELTLLWNVSIKHRLNAINNGISSLYNEKLTAEILGIKNKNMTELINRIIKVNSPYNDKIIFYDYNDDYIKNLLYDKICFVDFETINNESQILFMIGAGIFTDKWEYKCFYVNELNNDEEYRIVKEFKKFIKNRTIIHWSYAEKSILNKIYTKYSDLIRNHKWFDLYNYFINHKITIKGSYNFKLKNIGNALVNNKLINKFDDNISDGFEAMNSAIEYYNSKNNEIIQNIISYNENDCKLLYQIFSILSQC